MPDKVNLISTALRHEKSVHVNLEFKIFGYFPNTFSEK